jgi:hypothetical protein
VLRITKLELIEYKLQQRIDKPICAFQADSDIDGSMCVFYHVTLKSNIASILSNGLTFSKSRKCLSKAKPKLKRHGIYLIPRLEFTDTFIKLFDRCDIDMHSLAVLEVRLAKSFPISVDLDCPLTYDYSKSIMSFYSNVSIPPKQIQLRQDIVDIYCAITDYENETKYIKLENRRR